MQTLMMYKSVCCGFVQYLGQSANSTASTSLQGHHEEEQMSCISDLWRSILGLPSGAAACLQLNAIVHRNHKGLHLSLFRLFSVTLWDQDSTADSFCSQLTGPGCLTCDLLSASLPLWFLISAINVTSVVNMMIQMFHQANSSEVMLTTPVTLSASLPLWF